MKRQLAVLGLAAAAAACGGGGGDFSPANPPPPGPGTTPLYEVQGDGTSSPLVGQTVTVEGVVTGDFQENDADTSRNLGGFYIQSIPDGDFDTSDGIFIFDGNNPGTPVNVGDLVRVEGVVNEYFGETQISTSSVSVIGGGAILPAPVNLPAVGTVTNSDGELIADLERYEGMLVRFPQALAVANLRNLERFGEVGLAAGGRPYQFTNQNPPSVAGYRAHRSALAARSLLLDDGRRDENVMPIAWLTAGSDPGYSIRAGDEVVDLTGNLRFARGSGGNGDEAYRLMPTIDPVFVDRNPRPGPPTTAGSLRVVSLNTLNFFSTLDTGQDNCGPAANEGCRGADSATELTRQMDKLARTLDVADADIVGLVEIENNAGAALDALLAALNAVASRSYDYIDAGTIGTDVITTALIYDADTVAPVGAPVILDTSVDARFNDDKNRPALAQAFRQLDNNAVLSVVVNHLKSKGSPCDDLGDPNARDGQGNCNGTRTAAAEALADWVALDPTGSGDSDYLVIGDLNAYLFEDPLTALKSGGLVNLVETNGGGDAYSFSFDGQLGALDHALATAGLVPQVAAISEWHVNADEPPVRDYNLEFGRDPGLFEAALPYRTSDHDPLVIGLELTP